MPVPVQLCRACPPCPGSASCSPQPGAGEWSTGERRAGRTPLQGWSTPRSLCHRPKAASPSPEPPSHWESHLWVLPVRLSTSGPARTFPLLYLAELLLVLRHLLQHLGQVSHGGLQGKGTRSPWGTWGQDPAQTSPSVGVWWDTCAPHAGGTLVPLQGHLPHSLSLRCGASAPQFPPAHQGPPAGVPVRLCCSLALGCLRSPGGVTLSPVFILLLDENSFRDRVTSLGTGGGRSRQHRGTDPRGRWVPKRTHVGQGQQRGTPGTLTGTPPRCACGEGTPRGRRPRPGEPP